MSINERHYKIASGGFDWTSAGQVLAELNASGLRVALPNVGVNVKDPAYGAVGDGVADDTSAIQAALTALNASTDSGNRTIFFPPGNYKITATLQPPNSASYFTLAGAGPLASKITWAGSAGSPMLKIINARQACVRGMAFIGNASAKPTCGIEFNRAAGQVGAAAATGCKVVEVDIGGQASDSLGSGILFTCDSGQDTNNDDATFIGCRVYNVTNYGIAFQHLNSLIHTIVGCAFVNCLTAGISNVGAGNTSVATIGGSFSAYSCVSSGCGTCLELNGAPHAISVTSWQGESDDAFMTTPNSITGVYKLNVTLTAIDYTGNDGTVIEFDANAGNTLDMVGCRMNAPSTFTISCPTAGSRFNVWGGRLGFSTLSYNNEVVLHNVYIDAGDPTFTNLGSGTLFCDRSQGVSKLDAMKIHTSGATLDVNGMSGQVVYVTYAGATDLTTLSGGRVGDLVTLYATNGNATVKHNTGTNNTQLQGAVDFVMGAGNTLTLRKIDSTNSSRWVEVGRKT